MKTYPPIAAVLFQMTSACLCVAEPPAELIKAGEQPHEEIPLGVDFQPASKLTVF